MVEQEKAKIEPHLLDLTIAVTNAKGTSLRLETNNFVPAADWLYLNGKVCACHSWGAAGRHRSALSKHNTLWIIKVISLRVGSHSTLAKAKLKL